MMRYTQSRAALSAPILPTTLGALLIAAAVGCSANAQSFDCRNARHADEKAICQDSRLGDLDKQLAEVYDRAGGKLSKKEREAFETNETAFVNARHRCGDHAPCIEQSYRNRIQELLSALPEDAAGHSDRPDNAKRSDRQSDRQKAARDSGKTEEVQTGPDDTKREAGEAAVRPPEQSSGQKELGQKEPAQKEPAEKEPAQKESASAAAAVPNPPSRREAEAALAGQPPLEKSSRHKRHTESAAVTSAPAMTPAAPEREEPRAASAPAVTERHPRKSAAAPAPERHPVAEGSTAAAEPANPPEKRHSRTTHIASGTSAPSPAPADQAHSASRPEIKWVNPSPSR